jgi:hypothetical protein
VPDAVAVGGSFREKPREEEAAAMIEQAALWNCGVFAFKLDFIINILLTHGLPIQYDEMVKQYDKLQKNSFDYEVVENASALFGRIRSLYLTAHEEYVVSLPSGFLVLPFLLVRRVFITMRKGRQFACDA